MSKFQDEFKNLDDMEGYLEFNSIAIDQTNKERKEIRVKHNEITNQQIELQTEKKAIERDAKQIENSGLAARLKESVFADKDRFAFSFFLLCNKGFLLCTLG